MTNYNLQAPESPQEKPAWQTGSKFDILASHMNMLLIPIDEETRKQVDALTRAAGKPEKEVLRDVVKAGLKIYQTTPSASIKATLDLIEWAEKEQITGKATDVSTNHDKYAWNE